MKFDIVKEIKGKKTKVTISHEGRVIGERSSLRAYRFALVCTSNQAVALKSLQESAAYQEREALRYDRLAVRDPQEWAKNIRKHAAEFDSSCLEKYYAEGKFPLWAAQSREAAAKARAEAARLSEGPQPEFSQPYVVSWHQTRKNVPSPAFYQIFVAVVEVPE